MHTVYVDAFYIDIHEVTVGQYSQFVRATGHRSPYHTRFLQYSPTDRHPMVVGVSWHDAMAYAKWAGKRLPTEVEWEISRTWWLRRVRNTRGVMVHSNGTQCNFADKKLRKVCGLAPVNQMVVGQIKVLMMVTLYTAPVGSYPPNGYGLYDTAGNVWEWCFDAYNANFYASSPRRNPIAGVIVTR